MKLAFNLALRACLMPGLWVATTAMTAIAYAAGPADAKTNAMPGGPAKTHTAYMGADFAIEWHGKLRPVVDVEGSTFVIDVDGSRVVVPVRFKDLKIKMDDVLKVTATRADLTDYAAKRAYSPDADPKRKYDEAIQMASNAAAAVDLYTAQERSLQSVIDRSMGNTGDSLTSQLSAATANLGRSLDAQQWSINTMADAGTREFVERSRELYDAFELTFEITAPKRLVHPYLIVVTHYLENPEAANTGRLWVYAQSIDRVDTKPAKFKLYRGGFPPGYKLQDVQIHLYDGTTEIATNVARKSVALTADDAFQIWVVEYIQQHRDATVPPEPARDLIPHGLRTRVPGNAWGRTYYIRVAKNGLPIGVYLDETCTGKPADAKLQTILLGLRFNPALQKGKPVEGIAPVRMEQLPL